VNILRKYPELLELAYLRERERGEELMTIFDRDIRNNDNLNFRGNNIYPIKDDKPAMETLFTHLTCEEVEEADDTGKIWRPRVFDIHRSGRLHWIKFHIEEKKKDVLDVFSVEERVKGKTVFRTYVYDKAEKYVIVLHPQNEELHEFQDIPLPEQVKAYYLLTAYYFNRKYGEKQMKKKRKKKLDVVL
jgi:hypothetical protein